MTSQTGQQIITTHTYIYIYIIYILYIYYIYIYILPNISSKLNQTMKFGQVIECNVTNIHSMWWKN